MKTTHLCNWPGCRERRGADHFACRSHWDAFPASIKAAMQHARTPETKARAHQAAADWIKTRTPPLREPVRAFSEPETKE